MTAFVQPTSGEVIWYLSDGVSKPFFEKLLATFAREAKAGRDRRIVLVLDNAGWHTEPNLAVPDGIKLVYLPRYSPELHPAECLWPILDEPLANRHFDTLDQVDAVVAQRCNILNIVAKRFDLSKRASTSLALMSAIGRVSREPPLLVSGASARPSRLAFARKSSETAAKVFLTATFRPSLSSLAWSDGSSPDANARRAAKCLSRASASETAGYEPRASVFCFRRSETNTATTLSRRPSRSDGGRRHR